MVNPFRELIKRCYFEHEHRSFPLIVDVETTNLCNLHCRMCPIGQGTIKRKQGFMAGNVWNIVLKELTRHHTPVRFIRWGEPTLHEKIYDWISEAKEHGLLTHLTTNGTNLNVPEILDCGLDCIKISVYNEIPYNLYALYASHPRPYIIATTYDNGRTVIYCDEVRNNKIVDLSIPPEEYIPCPEVFGKLSVNWDGTISACCGDYDNKMLVGDVKESSLEKIWHSPKMNYYRKMLKEMRHSELELCRNCGREKWK